MNPGNEQAAETGTFPAPETNAVLHRFFRRVGGVVGGFSVMAVESPLAPPGKNSDPFRIA